MRVWSPVFLCSYDEVENPELVKGEIIRSILIISRHRRSQLNQRKKLKSPEIWKETVITKANKENTGVIKTQNPKEKNEDN